MTETLVVHTDQHTYPIIIGEDVLHLLPTVIQELPVAISKICIITDEKVGNLHADKLKKINELLTQYHPVLFVTDTGEQAKSFQWYQRILDFCIQQSLDRQSLIIAVGGGAIGDLAGFVAATFLRGIRFIQIPTTILAHDSAVGGKTGINHDKGKNLIGAFHQPVAVLYDELFFQTLSIQEKRSGLAEVVKASLIHEQPFYQEVINNIKFPHEITKENVHPFLIKAIQTKVNIVEKDVNEQGIRAYLNFGHTLGHAIEAEIGYGKITHGEAVMIGMLFALHLSIQYTGLSFPLSDFKTWAKNMEYPLHLWKDLHKQRLLMKMKLDKKAVSSKIRFILLKKIGQPVMKQLDDDILLRELKEFSL